MTSRSKSCSVTPAQVATAILAMGFASVALANGPVTTHITPSPQPPVQAISGRDLGPVQTLFNRDADRPRILVLLSPT